MDPKRKFSIFPKKDPPPTNTFFQIQQPKPDELVMSQSKFYFQEPAQLQPRDSQQDVLLFGNNSLAQASNIQRIHRVDPFMRTAPLPCVISQLDYTPSFIVKNGQLLVNENSNFYRQFTLLKNQSAVLNIFNQISERDVTNLTQSFEHLSHSWLEDEEILRKCEAMAEKLVSESMQLQRKIQKIEGKISGMAAQSQQTSVSPPSMGIKKYAPEIDSDEILETSMIYNEEQIAEIVRKRQESNMLKIPQLQNASLMSCISVKQIPQTTESDALINIINKEDFAIEWKKIKKLEQFIAMNEKKYLMSFRLLYRVAENCTFGLQSDISEKKGLLFLIKSSHGKFFGGYISKMFEEQTSDESAFIFSIQPENVYKLPVNEDDHYDAATSEKSYMVCFGRDLMISCNCLDEESYCAWPQSYSSYENYGSDWLAGGINFHIVAMDIYQVE